MKKWFSTLAVTPSVVLGVPGFIVNALAQEEAAPAIDTGDTAFMLVASALVLLMTPGLAFFYGGLVRRKNILSVLNAMLYVHVSHDRIMGLFRLQPGLWR